MLKYFWNLLFHSCKHKWKIESKIDVADGNVIFATKYIMMCEHCGKIKVKRV